MGVDIGAAVAAFHDRGFAIVADVVPSAWCEEVIAAAHRLPGALAGVPRAEMNVHRPAPLFERAMAHPEILRVIDRLVGGAANGLQSQFFFGPPGTRGFHPHQDNHYVEAEIDCFASAWLALMDIAPANGGLYVYPGSHKAGLLPVREMEGADFDARTGVRDATLVPERFPKQDLVVARGTVVFLHGYIVHGSYPNRSDGPRYALLNTYVRPGSSFRAGRTGGRSEHPLPRSALSTAA